ncbi:MAG: NAD-dependent epimerase/dehydratase family protein [Gemmatimonadaceae bacterium]
MKNKSACLVTGGAGFIGSHLADRLVAMGNDVRVVDNLSTGDEANLEQLSGKIEFIVGDLCDPAVCSRAVKDVSTVFHVAALPSVPRSLKDPWGSHDANVNATVRLLQACHKAGVKRVIYSSSSSVYGDTPRLPKEETMIPQPRSPYAASKLASEQYVLAFARAGLIEGVALRYFNIFGPRQSPDSPYAAVVPLFLRAIQGGEPLVLFGDGSQTRDFTYVDNAVDANVQAGARRAEHVSGLVANVGAGARTSLLELIAMMEKITGLRAEREVRPARAGDVKDSLAGLENARAVLDYTPRVRLEEGLRRTWEWSVKKRNGGRGSGDEAGGNIAAGMTSVRAT